MSISSQLRLACEEALAIGLNITSNTFFEQPPSNPGLTCICPVSALVLHLEGIHDKDAAIERLHFKDDEMTESSRSKRHLFEVDLMSKVNALAPDFEEACADPLLDDGECNPACNAEKTLADHIIHLVDEHGWEFERISTYLARNFNI